MRVYVALAGRRAAGDTLLDVFARLEQAQAWCELDACQQHDGGLAGLAGWTLDVTTDDSRTWRAWRRGSRIDYWKIVECEVQGG